MLKIKTYFRGQEVDPRITLSLRPSSLRSCLVVSSLSLSLFLSRSVVVVVVEILSLPLLLLVTAIIFVHKTLSIFFQSLQFSIPRRNAISRRLLSREAGGKGEGPGHAGGRGRRQQQQRCWLILAFVATHDSALCCRRRCCRVDCAGQRQQFLSPSATGVVIRSRDAFILYPDLNAYPSLLRFWWLCRLCLWEKQRDFSRQNLIIVFCFSPLSFLAVVADVGLCCDPVLCFSGVFVLGVRRNRRRKWKV